MTKLIVCLLFILNITLAFNQVNKNQNINSTLNENDSLQKIIEKYNKLKWKDDKLYRDLNTRIINIDKLNNSLKNELNDTTINLRYNLNINKILSLDTEQKFNQSLKITSDEDINSTKKLETTLSKIIQTKKEIDTICTSIYKNQFQINKEIKRIKDTVQKLRGSYTFKFYNGSTFCAYILNPQVETVNFHYKNKKNENFSSIENLKNSIEKAKLDIQMITNGGMYSPANEPQGLYIENKKTYKTIDTLNDKDGTNFYLFPNGVFYMDTLNNFGISSTENFIKKISDYSLIKNATQSGPMLINNGEIHKSFSKASQNEKIRSGVGITSSNQLVFLITLDDCNFYDFAICYKEIFDCNNALFLDGAISKMFIKDIPTNFLNGLFVPMISITKKQ
jgi:uncharacterized protein YigE (DUF2233 family)